MRFCMITTFYPPYHFGGDAIFVQALARALMKEGHEVEVVYCEDSYRLGAGSEQSLPDSSLGEGSSHSHPRRSI